VIDRKGILRYAESGGFTQEGLDEVIGPLIAETAEAQQGEAEQSQGGQSQGGQSQGGQVSQSQSSEAAH
jgi:hypothetical protein